jgi:hypothetical protein
MARMLVIGRWRLPANNFSDEVFRLLNERRPYAAGRQLATELGEQAETIADWRALTEIVPALCPWRGARSEILRGVLDVVDEAAAPVTHYAPLA